MSHFWGMRKHPNFFRKVPFYMQFTPGYVVQVVNNRQSRAYRGRHTINTIIAKSHLTDKGDISNKRNLSDLDIILCLEVGRMFLLKVIQFY